MTQTQREVDIKMRLKEQYVEKVLAVSPHFKIVNKRGIWRASYEYIIDTESETVIMRVFDLRIYSHTDQVNKCFHPDVQTFAVTTGYKNCNDEHKINKFVEYLKPRFGGRLTLR